MAVPPELSAEGGLGIRQCIANSPEHSFQPLNTDVIVDRARLFSPLVTIATRTFNSLLQPSYYCVCVCSNVFYMHFLEINV